MLCVFLCFFFFSSHSPLHLRRFPFSFSFSSSSFTHRLGRCLEKQQQKERKTKENKRKQCALKLKVVYYVSSLFGTESLSKQKEKQRNETTSEIICANGTDGVRVYIGNEYRNVV